ncbi:hypothetical protein B296_00053271 [Ensete ventricosum]|uniref:Uncharacterized protein n=1 Tax=Ensete ventricosum TaxID=4639 RepID=A0A426XAA5_ENSVE|nr:hypothetical protein B296_00053271 [Ensete ventricosum]
MGPVPVPTICWYIGTDRKTKVLNTVPYWFTELCSVCLIVTRYGAKWLIPPGSGIPARLEKFPNLMCCVASRGSLGVRASATRGVNGRSSLHLKSIPSDGGCIPMTLLWAPPPDKCRRRVLWPFWLPWWRLNVSTWSDPGSDSVKDVEGSIALATEAATPPALRTGWLQSLAFDMDGLALSSGHPVGDPCWRSTAVANPSVSSTDDEHLRLRAEYKWFLMALSVRPERRVMVSSSSIVKGRCSTQGDGWLHHRRRHDLPDRPGMDRLMSDQFLGPCRSTRRRSASSSSALHVHVTRSISLLRPATIEVAAAVVTMFIHKHVLDRLFYLCVLVELVGDRNRATRTTEAVGGSVGWVRSYIGEECGGSRKKHPSRGRPKENTPVEHPARWLRPQSRTRTPR